MMGALTEDVCYGFRRLRRSPGFTFTALATLVLGIGATTAIFTLTYQVLLKSIPVDHPEQIYKVGQKNKCCDDSGLQDDWNLFSYDLYRTLRDQTPGTSGIAAEQSGETTLAVRRKGETAAQPIAARLVSGNYFDVLGVKTFAGRLLRPEDDHEGAPTVAVLSYAIWQTKFHSDPAIVGETVMMTGRPVTIVGISANGFLGDRTSSDAAGVWIPLANEPLLTSRGLYLRPFANWLDLLVRIPGAKQVPQVQSSLRVALVRWLLANRDPSARDIVADIQKQTTELVSASGGISNLRDQYEKGLLLLQMIAGFVLLIACANLANLMLVRGLARRQELNLRSALGASRTRLVREMLIESLLLAVAGGALGLAAAYLGVKGMLALAMRGVQVVPVSASPSLPVLGFALAVSVVTGILFGIAPAWMAANSNPAEALRGANRSTGHAGGLQRALVIAQSALSIALLSTSGLLILSLNQLQRQDFRFETKGRLIAFIDLQAAGYKYEQLDGLYRQMEQVFASVPTLHDMAYATYGPMAYSAWGTNIVLESKPDTSVHAGYTTVSNRFFSAVGTQLIQGRVFTDGDTSNTRHVAVVNKEFVRKVLDGRPALGALFGPDRRMATEYQIVGVVDDSKYGDPSQPTAPMFFTPMAQLTTYGNIAAPDAIIQQANENERFGHYASNLIVRYDGDAASATAAVRRALNQVNPEIPITHLTTYDDQVSGYFTQQQLIVRLTSIFGALALLLASIGLYGVTAYGVARRIREIGVRMALGADRASVVRMVLQGAAWQVGLGILAGVPLALVGQHLLQSQLYEVKGTNLAPLAAACAVLILSALIASALPARRAAEVEPMQALRTE